MHISFECEIVLPTIASQNFRMDGFYKFCFDLNDKHVVVIFFDKKPMNITQIESLAQIGHAHRRQWGRLLLEHIAVGCVEKITFASHEYTHHTPFATHLAREGWTEGTILITENNLFTTIVVYRTVRVFLFSFVNTLPSM